MRFPWPQIPLVPAALCAAWLSCGCGTEPSAPAPATAEQPLCVPDNVPGTWDFVVVGSGAGGGPLASRLARAGCRVLLIEAGEDVGGSVQYQVPAMHALSTENGAMAWWYFVQHHAEPGLDAQDSKYTPEGILYPRGSALGGSTAVNALVTVLPPPSDWNRLAAITGEPGFRASEMQRYFDRVREWLGVEVPDSTLALGDSKLLSLLASAANAQEPQQEGNPFGLPGTAGQLSQLLQRDLNDSLSSAETTGLFRIPLATRAGRRSSTREFILDTIARGYPLTLSTNTLATRVLFDSNAPTRAVGVEIVTGRRLYQASLGDGDAPSAPQAAYATKEVILSAGAFNSPQLLQLSGIGDPDALTQVGIAPRHALPGVGKNLQDRVEISVVSEFDEPFSVIERCQLAELSPDSDPCVADWLSGRGVYQTSGFLATVLRRSSPEVPQADLQVFGVPGDGRGYYPGYALDAAKAKSRFSWLILKAHTNNRDGEVTVSSNDPFVRPSINFRSFDEQDPLADPDLAALVKGIQFVRDVQDRMRQLYPDDPPSEVWPGPSVASAAELAKWTRKEAWGHHASCSNKMGHSADPSAVVDPRFRVIGTEHLRVVDASVFPEIPGTFVALPTFMLSEKAADVILEDYR
ncbi:MAG: GMC family oxidoreductase N-terminal domain-containing protein [Polyangiaceae bacterium]